MKLTVVIVNYNVRYYVEQCLRSLQRALANVDAQVYVVDNHSKDDSVALLQPLFPDVHFVASNHNLGFARANNIAIRQTESDYVLLLNPDTIVAEDTIARCVEFMDAHPDAGVVGVKMLTTTGKPALESRRAVPSPMVSFYKMTGLCARFPKSRRFGRYYLGYLPWDQPVEIEVASGAFSLLRREAIDKVGLLDEDFFMYGEDIDLSYRLLKGGYRNWYLPQRILHYKGESTKKSSFRYVHVFYEAMLIFFRKHYGHLSGLLSIPIKIAIYGKAFLALISMVTERVSRSLGFFVRSASQQTDYLFVGSEQMIERCREIARTNGLNATFLVGDGKSLPEGHATVLDRFGKNLTNVVYDTSAYSYDTIFDIFEHHEAENVRMAFYHPESNVIITEREIYK